MLSILRQGQEHAIFLSPCLAVARDLLAPSSNRMEVPRSGAQNSLALPLWAVADNKAERWVSLLCLQEEDLALQLGMMEVGGQPFLLPCGQGQGPSPCPILEAMKNPRQPKRGQPAGRENWHWRVDTRWTSKG